MTKMRAENNVHFCLVNKSEQRCQLSIIWIQIKWRDVFQRTRRLRLKFYAIWRVRFPNRVYVHGMCYIKIKMMLNRNNWTKRKQGQTSFWVKTQLGSKAKENVFVRLFINNNPVNSTFVLIGIYVNTENFAVGTIHNVLNTTVALNFIHGTHSA